jgi:CHRD domain
MAAATACLLLASAACSGSPTSSPPASPSATATAPISTTLVTTPTGTATLTWDPNSKLITAAIDAYGFTPGSAHAVHIHPGSCAHQTQPPSVPFADLTADTSGAVKENVASSTPAPKGIPSGSYLNIHLAPGSALGSPTDVSFTPIACADIPAGSPATGPVTVTFRTPSKNGQTPHATATLTYDPTGHTLRVDLKAGGLSPNSAHAVHIHSGTCRAQGDVAYPLPDLTANATGDATLSATVTNVTTPPPAHGWYLNVHLGPMSQILAAGKPTLLFAPILCGDITP